MLANYAARSLGWQRSGWAQAEAATSAYFAPPGTFAARLEACLKDVSALGFAAVDLWQPMFDPPWITDEHLEIAAGLLDQYGLQAVSFAGWLGADEDAFEATCEIASALGVTLLTGDTSADRAFVSSALAKYGLRWGYENELECSSSDLLARTGNEPLIGVCLDVGALVMQGCDPVAALEGLAPRLFHVHLKDIRPTAAGETCRFGDGVVPLQAVVRWLQAAGYAGSISIEHENAPYDPSEEASASLARLTQWLGGTAS